MSLDSRCDQSLAVVAVGNVGGHSVRTRDAVRYLLEALPPTCGKNDAGPCSRRRRGHVYAEPGTRARDDHDPVLQRELA
jgi:hypothetical protein